jgi:hypothetical protein
MSTEIHVLFLRTPEGPEPIRAYYTRAECVNSIREWAKVNPGVTHEKDFWIVKTQLEETHVGNQEHPTAG